jgi:hypothetical protein
MPYFAQPIERPHLIRGKATLGKDSDMIDAPIVVLVRGSSCTSGLSAAIASIIIMTVIHCG